MKDYEKEFMRQIYKEIKIMQENKQQKELVKFINLANIRAIYLNLSDDVINRLYLAKYYIEKGERLKWLKKYY